MSHFERIRNELKWLRDELKESEPICAYFDMKADVDSRVGAAESALSQIESHLRKSHQFISIGDYAKARICLDLLFDASSDEALPIQYGVGVERDKDSFGMCSGPSPDLRSELEIDPNHDLPSVELDDPVYIVELPSGRKLYSWDWVESRWVEEPESEEMLS